MNLFFDIGASKIKIGWSKNLKKIEGYKILDTPKKYKDFLNFIKENIRTYDVPIIVFGFPGVFDRKKEKLIYSSNLKDFENRNLKKDLEKISKADIYLENDALLAGLGEAVYGAGKNFNIVTYITLSTGVGGARIVNKRPDEKFFGFEPGHSYFLISGDLFPIEVENLISGLALERIFGKKPEKINNQKIWQEINFLVSLFLVNVSLFWSPEVIIIGGGLSKSLDINLIRKNFSKLFPFKIKPRIIKSKLKNKSSLYGSLYFIKEKIYSC